MSEGIVIGFAEIDSRSRRLLAGCVDLVAAKATRNNRYIRTADHVGRPIASGVGIPSGGHRGAEMRLSLIFPRLAESITMKNLFQPLLWLIAGVIQKELARQVRYLKVENEILRSKLPARVTVTMTVKEKNRLPKFAAKLGSAINELVSIVHPETLRRWIRALNQTVRKKVAKRGRPKTDTEIRELILKLARENEWGLHPDHGRVEETRNHAAANKYQAPVSSTCRGPPQGPEKRGRTRCVETNAPGRGTEPKASAAKVDFLAPHQFFKAFSRYPQ